MEFKTSRDKIFILGAGASVDYGLPTWSELNDLVRAKIINDTNNQYKYKDEIISWLDNVGVKKTYKTIDECMKLESASAQYHDNGHEIEDNLFRIIKDTFDEIYKDNQLGWIRKLNEIIKDNKEIKLEKRLAFINYNYDNVLDRNFLNFNYLSAKHRQFNYRERLEELSGARSFCFHPHGYFQSEIASSRIIKEVDTIKSGIEEFIDAVSCHESKSHVVTTYSTFEKVSLFILGLGGGLEINLNNLKFINKISEIHITIRDEKIRSNIINFLSEKFNIPPTEIKVYNNCDELIMNCFN